MNSSSLLHKTFNKEKIDRPPMWLMRQAGRYLPEYREIRKSTSSFLDMCYTPEKAAEVTLQPLRRYNFDVAILFSDILVIPHALGMKVEFIAGTGPVLGRPSEEELKIFSEKCQHYSNNAEHLDQILNPIYETVRRVKQELREDQALMGFCGAPWTVLLYMLDEKPSKGSDRTREIAYKTPELFDTLMESLVEASAHYLCSQIEAGADALQIFDSWALQVPHTLYDRAVKQPLYRLCEKVKEKHPNIPIILFPRGLSEQKLIDLVKDNQGCFDGLSIDYTVDPKWAADMLQDHIVVQGNLDPTVMLSTPEVIKEETEKLLTIMTQKPGYIFNFGHGILPHVPVEHVAVLAETVQSWKSGSVS